MVFPTSALVIEVVVPSLAERLLIEGGAIETSTCDWDVSTAVSWPLYVTGIELTAAGT